MRCPHCGSQMYYDRDIHGAWLTCITCSFQLNADGTFIDRTNPDGDMPAGRAKRRFARLRGTHAP